MPPLRPVPPHPRVPPAPRPGRWRGLVVGWLIASVVAGALGVAVLGGQLGGHGSPPAAPAGTPQVQAPPAGRALVGSGLDEAGGRLPAPAGRPAASPLLPGENRHAAVPAVVSPEWVSGEVAGAQVVLADAALPWRWWLDPAVPEVVDEAVVRSAVAAWDGVAGSRWETTFAGYAEPGVAEGGASSSGRAVADGRSTIFLEDACAGLTTANAYLFADGGVGAARYGTRASQIVEADIGVCPRIVDPDALRLAIVHEVGHVVGLAHLCDPGEDCWREGMGEGPHGCRVMFWQARPCQLGPAAAAGGGGLVAADRLALATTYPVLRPAWGPTPAEAAARTAFALWPDAGSAPAAVVAPSDLPAAALAAAGVLAAELGGPLLIGDPAAGCLAGPAEDEAARALARRGRLVLVGDWPAERCRRLAHDWQVQLALVRGDTPAAVADGLLELRGADGGAEAAVVWVGPAEDGGVLAAAAAAVVDGAPLVLAPAPPRDVGLLASALAAAGVRRVVLAGPGAEAEAAAVRVAVPQVEVLDVADPVAAALQVAASAGGAAGRPAVLAAAAGSPASAAVALAAAAHLDGALLLSGPALDARVLDRLVRTAPSLGWVVGSDDLLPHEVRAAYGEAISARSR